MRQPLLISVATWMIERGTPRTLSEALAGDLLEELHAGRSTGWYWRQALVAVGQSAASRVRPHATALGYSVFWGVLFPLCSGAVWDRYWPAALDRWAALDWPWSSLLLISGGLLPAVSCVWLGLLVYVFAVAGAKPSGVRLIGSLSLSLNVLFVTKIGLLSSQSATGPHVLMQETAFLSAQHPAWSVPLVLSLWAAIACALRAPHVASGRSSSPV